MNAISPQPKMSSGCAASYLDLSTNSPNITELERSLNIVWSQESWQQLFKCQLTQNAFAKILDQTRHCLQSDRHLTSGAVCQNACHMLPGLSRCIYDHHNIHSDKHTDFLHIKTGYGTKTVSQVALFVSETAIKPWACACMELCLLRLWSEQSVSALWW